jgi:hypothetical protein
MLAHGIDFDLYLGTLAAIGIDTEPSREGAGSGIDDISPNLRRLKE